MAKHSKKSNETAVPESGSSAPNARKPAARKASKAKSAKTKARPKSPGKRASTTADTPAAARRPRATTTLRETRAVRKIMISDEAIRIRAYFIAEQRMQNGVPGDSADDWLEARRQLQEEAGKSA